ncbi:hypothetical protein Vadar_004992 [Vaccinium darrowii]|uniref:Uncharacterized protein n=1 Tax=Vaccinium darrowii TaxID=229202 RepID=A0ACB7ZHY1_9ERIC|nr:hypothetical protein Vadar_004992 [Vaccinium darrowii]
MAEEPVNVNEFQEMARQTLPKMSFEYYNGGAEDQHTLKENTEAFQRITFRPRILVDVSRIDMSTTILGHPISAPIMIAPTAFHKLAHPEGEVATARAAAACNTIMICKRRDLTATLVQSAERYGFKAIILTVDTPRLGRREAEIKNRMIAPQMKIFEGLLSTEVASVIFRMLEHMSAARALHQYFANSPFAGCEDNGSKLEAYAAQILDSSLSWKDIEWLRSITSLPILLKGVLTPEDAIKATEVGVDGIIVSNHGARQLDYSPATITVLEEVVVAVGGKIPVFIDGGIRRGTDIFKALALGAKAIMIGRPVLYGLAAKGEQGVRQVMEMLKNELELTMALSGCPTLKDITRSHIAAAAGIVGSVAAEYPELRATPPVAVKQQLVGVSLYLVASAVVAVASAAATVSAAAEPDLESGQALKGQRSPGALAFIDKVSPWLKSFSGLRPLLAVASDIRAYVSSWSKLRKSDGNRSSFCSDGLNKKILHNKWPNIKEELEKGPCVWTVGSIFFPQMAKKLSPKKYEKRKIMGRGSWRDASLPFTDRLLALRNMSRPRSVTLFRDGRPHTYQPVIPSFCLCFFSQASSGAS